jgi:hypothetical protein
MEAAGIKFIGENGGGPRVRLKTGHSVKILSPQGLNSVGKNWRIAAAGTLSLCHLPACEM